MNPTRIAAENYRSFDSLDADIPAGVTAIVGDNGT